MAVNTDESITMTDMTTTDGTALGSDGADDEQAGPGPHSATDAADPAQRAGATLWFTGLPSAGKSTIAHAVADELKSSGVAVEVLDGDQVRPYLSSELGFSAKDRDLNVIRVGFVARLLARHGVIALVPVIAPYAAARAQVRADHEQYGAGFAEVHVSTSREVAEQRDVKGLYAKARDGEIHGFTGVDDPYEEPEDAELVVNTAEVDVATAVAMSKGLAAALTGRDLG